VDTIAEYEELRGGIERTHSTNRDAREKQFIADREALVNDYQSDLADIEQARRAALVAAGLNPDGSDPQGRQQGS
jgi:tryptophanyl-tRNA synthetase